MRKNWKKNWKCAHHSTTKKLSLVKLIIIYLVIIKPNFWRNFKILIIENKKKNDCNVHQKRYRELGTWNRNFTTAPLEFRRPLYHPRPHFHHRAAQVSLRLGVLARPEAAWAPRHPPILPRFPPRASFNRQRTVSALSPSSRPVIPTRDFRIYRWPPQPPLEVTRSISIRMSFFLMRGKEKKCENLIFIR